MKIFLVEDSPLLRARLQDAPHIAVYVLTNYPSEPHRRKAASLGARGFFDKSLDVSGLGAALAALVA